MKVRAVEKGFHVTIREPDEEFEMDGPAPNWCKPVGEVEPTKQTDNPPGDTSQPAGAPTTETGKGFNAYHAGAGRYGIKDATGERFGDFTGTKEEAEAEAARLNAGDPDLTDQDNGLPDA